MTVKARGTITVMKERDITSVTWYYKLQASTAAAPERPTTATPSGWSTTEPSYTEGSTNSLYICQKTTFSDETWSYSDVSLSSSYEAAKIAYNQASAAARAAEASCQMANVISQGFGMYKTDEVQQDGSTISYLHDAPTVAASSYVCYWTSSGIMASVDGGTTWALDSNGNALFNVLTAHGINADWINTGALVIRDADNNEIFRADATNKTVKIADWNVLSGILTTTVDDASTSTIRRKIQFNALTGEIVVQKLEKSSGAICGDIIISKDKISFGVYDGGSLWYRNDLYMSADGQRGTFCFDSGAPYGGQLGIANYNNGGDDLYTGITDISAIGDGTVTGAISTLNSSKQKTITGAATTIANSNLTASRALISNASGKVAVSAITSTELGYLDGVTSKIQTQINDLANSFTNNNGTNVTLSNAVWKTVASVTLAAGSYLLIGVGRFGVNGNGTRVIRFSHSQDSNVEINRYSSSLAMPSPNVYTYIEKVMATKVTSSTTIYLNAYQDCGSSLAISNTGICVVNLV